MNGRLLRRLLGVLGLFAACGGAAVAATADSAARYYTMADFPHVDKIDAHMHVIGAADRLMAQAIADDFRILTINTDYPDFPPIPEQQAAAESLRRAIRAEWPLQRPSPWRTSTRPAGRRPPSRLSRLPGITGRSE